jgi:hypothetical protein
VQVARIGQLAGDVARKRADYRFEGFLFFAQRLGAFRIVPDFWVFEDLVQFCQFFRFAIEVKDTSAVGRRDCSGRRCGWRRH